MNSRRSFFAQLAVAVAGTVVAPSILARCAPDAFKWRKTTHGLYVVNPEWLTAEYEIRFLFEPGMLTPCLMSREGDSAASYSPKPGQRFIRESFPIRQNAKGKYVCPMIEIFP